jgi:hypothetical protein
LLEGRLVKAVLVFIDGTICDTRQRHHLGIGTREFYERGAMLRDPAVSGSVECMKALSQKYKLVYMGARPEHTLQCTQEWLAEQGFPEGPVYLRRTQQERLDLVRLLQQELDFAAGVGDRWDDNELHREIGCLSIILKEFEGNWDAVRRHLLGDDQG